MSALHPGELIAPLLLEPAGISQSELSRRLGFNQPQPVNELVKGKRGFTPKMALLFEQVTEGEFPAVFERPVNSHRFVQTTDFLIGFLGPILF